jgi:hypothetical protein
MSLVEPSVGRAESKANIATCIVMREHNSGTQLRTQTALAGYSHALTLDHPTREKQCTVNTVMACPKGKSFISL